MSQPSRLEIQALMKILKYNRFQHAELAQCIKYDKIDTAYSARKVQIKIDQLIFYKFDFEGDPFENLVRAVTLKLGEGARRDGVGFENHHFLD